MSRGPARAAARCTWWPRRSATSGTCRRARSRCWRGVDWIAPRTRGTRAVLLERLGLAARLVCAHAHNERRAGRAVPRLERASPARWSSTPAPPGSPIPGRGWCAAAAAGSPVRSCRGRGGGRGPVGERLRGRCLHLRRLPAGAPPARGRRLVGLLARPETVVFFEAPHRVRATLECPPRALPAGRWRPAAS